MAARDGEHVEAGEWKSVNLETVNFEEKLDFTLLAIGSERHRGRDHGQHPVSHNQGTIYSLSCAVSLTNSTPNLSLFLCFHFTSPEDCDIKEVIGLTSVFDDVMWNLVLNDRSIIKFST